MNRVEHSTTCLPSLVVIVSTVLMTSFNFLNFIIINECVIDLQFS